MRTLTLFALSLFASAAAMAQTHAYVLAAPGFASGGGSTLGLIHLAAGGEAVLKSGIARGIGAGAEFGILGRTDLGALGVFSVNGTYHFKPDGRAVPFVTGGYSSFFTFDNHENLANLGGGLNYWYADHFGIKLEFRDHFRTGRGTVNYAEFRFGFMFK